MAFFKKLTVSKKTILLRKMGNESVRHFMKGFSSGGFYTDKSMKGWQARKREYNHPILKETGALRDSIKVRTIVPLNIGYVDVGTSGIPYAAIHNEGLVGNTFGRTFVMPKREYVGEHRQLTAKHMVMIRMAFSKI